MSTRGMLLYLATWSLVALSPGPAVMCVVSQATRYGLRHALVGVAGIQLGHFVFFGCIASGLAALLAAASTAFAVLRAVGAAYLLYLGVRSIVGTIRKPDVAPAPAPVPSRGSLLAQGFAIQVTNPKALLFMSALLPQFIEPDRPLPTQLLVLLALTLVVDVVVLGGYAWFALRGARALRKSGVAAWLERAFGVALICFGIRLLLDVRK